MPILGEDTIKEYKNQRINDIGLVLEYIMNQYWYIHNNKRYLGNLYLQIQTLN